MSAFYQSENLIQALNTARTKAIRGIVETTSLDRKDREILQQTGHIRPIMRGWYQFSDQPEPAAPNTMPPTTFFRFLAIYLNKRLGEKWCFSAESSLELLLFPDRIPPRLVVVAMYGSTTLKNFPGLTKLTVYQDGETYHPGFEQTQGLRLLPLEMAISRLPRKVWHNNPTLIAAALDALGSIEDITWRLLQEARQQTAGRLATALQKAGRIEEGNTIITRLTQAGYPLAADVKIRELAPAPMLAPAEIVGPNLISSGETISSLWTQWSQWRNSLQHLMMSPAGGHPPLLQHLAGLQEIHLEDTIHSLQLSGFQPTREFILDSLAIPEKNAEAAGWPILKAADKLLPEGHAQPLTGDMDPMTSLACQGYLDAFKAVKRSIIRLLEKEEVQLVVSEDLQGWLQALIEPSTQGGFYPPATISELRSGPSKTSLTGNICPAENIAAELNVLQELLTKEEGGIYQATMANLALHWLSPWQTGNGRMARFLMNALLAGAGCNWSIISGTLQEAYRRAVADALETGNAGPMAILISNGSIRTPH